ncbi:MAG: OadG family protein [Clostridia bacterium]|nr:OadG family protein [Clostridia bacterium]
MNVLFYGLSVAFVGMLTVFTGLVILIGLIKAMEKVLAGVNTGDLLGSFRPQPKVTPIVIDTTAMGNEEVVAVITAAIATVLEKEAEAKGEKKSAQPQFVVRSIRRISNAPAWNRAGREEQVYSRM